MFTLHFDMQMTFYQQRKAWNWIKVPKTRDGAAGMGTYSISKNDWIDKCNLFECSVVFVFNGHTREEVGTC